MGHLLLEKSDVHLYDEVGFQSITELSSCVGSEFQTTGAAR